MCFVLNISLLLLLLFITFKQTKTLQTAQMPARIVYDDALSTMCNIYLWYCQHKINRCIYLNGLHYWLCFCIYVCSLCLYQLYLMINGLKTFCKLHNLRSFHLSRCTVQHKYYWMSKYLLVYFYLLCLQLLYVLLSVTVENSIYSMKSSMNFHIHK